MNRFMFARAVAAWVGLSLAACAQAQNWWRPGVDTTWQWQLSGKLDTRYDVQVYDVDLFDTPDDTFAELKAAGRKVVCYLSAGSAENWRPDYSSFQRSDLGHALDGWPGERWVDTRSQNVRAIMSARLDLAASRGCDGVEPDNVDAYTNRSGFPLTRATQIDYNRFLAGAAHARGLAVGLKNDVGQLAVLEPSFDFALNEQCNQYKECAGYSSFTGNGKPVFNAEYAHKYRKNTKGARDQLCAAMKAARIQTLVLALKLDDRYRYSCF
jgi:hypothetical protein